MTASDKSFHDYVVHDLLGDDGGISSRAMFGGWAIYRNGAVFGIIVSGELYFKVGADNLAEFERMGSRRFLYTRPDGKSVALSYWLVPEDAMDDRERLRDLMLKSVAVSRKNKNTAKRIVRRAATGKSAGPAAGRGPRRLRRERF